MKHAVFSLNVDIALGPYDFDGYFHHYFWDIIGIYVLKLSNNSFSRFVSFFIQIWMLFSLIPKVDGVKHITNFVL